MKKEQWFRFYTSVLDPDDKTQDLPDRLYRQWTYFMCAYRKSGGVMPDTKALSRCLRVRETDVYKVLKQLEDAGLMDHVGDSLAPHDWDEMQFESDTSTERVRAFRERCKKRKGNVSETPSENIVQSNTPIVPKLETEEAANPTLNLEFVTVDPYTTARDEVWSFWPKDKRQSKAQTLSALRRLVPKGKNSETLLKHAVIAARAYTAEKGDYTKRFDRYVTEVLDGLHTPSQPKPAANSAIFDMNNMDALFGIEGQAHGV